MRYAALYLFLIALAGCSAEVSSGSAVTTDDLTQQVATQMTPDGAEEVAATCDGELEAEVGATQDCSVRVEDRDVAVRVIATEVEGKDVAFDIVPIMAAEDLEAAVAANYTAESEIIADCPGGLDGVVGAQQRCTVTVGPDTVGVEVSTTGLDGANIEFSAVPVLSPEAVAEAALGVIQAQGTGVENLTCADELRGEKGERITCDLVLNGKESELKVVVTKVDGLMVNFKLKG